MATIDVVRPSVVCSQMRMITNLSCSCDSLSSTWILPARVELSGGPKRIIWASGRPHEHLGGDLVRMLDGGHDARLGEQPFARTGQPYVS